MGRRAQDEREEGGDSSEAGWDRHWEKEDHREDMRRLEMYYRQQKGPCYVGEGEESD